MPCSQRKLYILNIGRRLYEDQMMDKRSFSLHGTPEVFHITAIECKGLGACASSNIKSGDLLIEEHALMAIDSSSSSEQTQLNHDIFMKLKRLDKHQQRRFLDLNNNFKDLPPFLGIARTNTIPLGSGASRGGIFPLCSRFNHACVSNAAYSYDHSRGLETIYATKDITCGTEITVNYVSDDIWLLECLSRRSKIREEFGFDCHCELCQSGKERIKRSDVRRRALANFDQLISDGRTIVDDPAKALKACRDSLKLLREENEEVMRSPGVYYDAFQICVAHSDLARASAFARLAVSSKLAWQSTADAEIQAYVMNPRLHPSFGVSRKWQTKMSYRKEEHQNGFQDWLWRRC